jgi:hypothetical protein
VEEDELAGWEAAGFRAIARGQVAAVLVATGLVPGAAAAAAAGDAPAARATEPAAGLPSGKAPLQLYAERILRLQRLAAAAAHGANAPVARPIQFVIMTSPDTHAQVWVGEVSLLGLAGVLPVGERCLRRHPSPWLGGCLHQRRYVSQRRSLSMWCVACAGRGRAFPNPPTPWKLSP